MKTDNQWHPAICVKKSNGSFLICDSLLDAKQSGGEFQRVKVNWNNGQPIVDFGDFQMSIVDITLAIQSNP